MKDRNILSISAVFFTLILFLIINIPVSSDIHHNRSKSIENEQDLNTSNSTVGPTPEVLGGISGVGFFPVFNVSFNADNSDNDTIQVNITYRRSGIGSFVLGQNRTINVSNLVYPDSSNGTHFFVYFDDVNMSYGFSWINVDIQIRAKDIYNNVNSAYYWGIPIIRTRTGVDVPGPALR
jgi:hypothetical protein